MEVTGAGKSPNATLSFKYNANNEELEELFQPCEDDPPTPQCEPPVKEPVSASPKRGDKTSIIDKYFKSIRNEKPNEKTEDAKVVENKFPEESRSSMPPKEVTSSPMKDYLNRLGKRSTSDVIPEAKDSGNETWKIFHDFKFKIAQAVEDMKTRSVDETKDRSIPRESSTSDSEENSAIKDTDQQSVGDTDNQVSSLDSSLQNLSEMTQPITAKASEQELSLSANKNQLDSNEDTHKNIVNNEPADVPRDDSIEIESGVEALEDTIEVFGDISQQNSDTPEKKPSEFTITQSPIAPTDFNFPPSRNDLHSSELPNKPKAVLFTYTMCPDYDPFTYHINKTTTAFMKLEGCNLRISYTKTKIAKRALWDEKIDNVTFYQHRLYNLTGARIILLPKGLVKRRQWSKKYPICVILNEKEKIQVLEKESAAVEKKISESTDKRGKETQPANDTESAEANTSPEKKKKFVWRRREKSNSQSEGEPGREGLRHRLVRKIHRDKRSDSVPSSSEAEAGHERAQPEECPTPEPDADLTSRSVTSAREEVNDDDIDDSELSRIKELLDEAELDGSADGAAEGEWSLHVKQSKDNHSRLFLFARTGRDKHEWYRRLNTAISEAQSGETSAADARPAETTQETKDGVELAVFKLSEKETVAFAKSKTGDPVSEGVTITTSRPLSPQVETFEKTFWPYLFKIIQPQTVGVECACRTLPAEVTWVNTVLARLMFDVMRDPATIARLQNRIQRKLNTLKLPSFMSPLLVTELSLTGACPLVRGVSQPSWDERGVWLDADLRYDGGAHIAILTQINLMKLKEKNMTLEDQMLTTSENVEETEVKASSSSVGPENLLRRNKPAIYDSEIEDSAESSSDDESPPMQPVDSKLYIAPAESPSAIAEGGSSKKKFLRMVDKIATNKYFQQVTDYKYVKRAMEGLSNTDIKLQLEVHGLEGRLAVNLPPPPHDRVWIGFRTNPQLVLRARPAVGARALRFAHISNWIEQKLTREFEKVLVLPNMEDILVDLMTPTPVRYEYKCCY
ncbi:unnamed protein product, partial [Iphiclides podalirius]